MNILIGSKAIKYWFPEFPREPKDTDYASDESDLVVIDIDDDGTKTEYYPIPPLMKIERTVLDPHELYTLKMSHIFWDIQWEKTIFDIVWLQKNGAKLDHRLFYDLYFHWEKTHGKPKRADLAASVEEFFDNGIKDGHEHDNLHYIIKNPPTYTKILKEPDGVEIVEPLFWLLSHEEKLDSVREECYVMAYERMGKSDYREAYLKQLKAWILVHGPSVEMAKFAVENYDVLRVPLINYKEVIDYGRQNEL